MNSPVSHAKRRFLLVSSKRQISNDTGDVGAATNNSRPRFTLTILRCHYTILIPNPTKIFLGRYMAALNASADNIFCSFTYMDFVVYILLKIFSSVWLSHLDVIYAEGNLTNFHLGEFRKIRYYVASIFSHAYIFTDSTTLIWIRLYFSLTSPSLFCCLQNSH